MNLICKGCKKTIKVSIISGGELLAVTSILGHILTCKEIKATAETQSEGLKEFLKVFFEINE